MKRKIYFTSLLIVIFMSGCVSKNPTHIDLEITSGKEINVDDDNVSSPLMLVFYELSSADKFSKYNYWDIVDNSGKKLKQDILSQTKYPILPNEKQTYQIVFDEKAKYLGIVAKFRDIKDSNWRYIINLEKDSSNEAELKIKKYSITEDE
ncbi:type VI secretion system lipoprotein TssJ [Sulfurimonas sp. HSL3-2]|uniref:type VI secretion system lipoprotein TssJ n=1 Tax=Hydrocurvibacter mobilis TaxID=3131936 RepID=UPI0031F8ECFE